MFYNTLLLCIIAEKRQVKKFYKKVIGHLYYKIHVIGQLPSKAESKHSQK